ncbi:MAG: helix-turn-helix domain-containing protein [Planctomycetaceae bacterium]|nr:helix-turn-helix domain-containing protein [Planctomycetaceae bacterium]
MTTNTLNFGSALRQLRAARSLTQRALAESSGLTINYLSLLENGQRQPSYDAIQSLSEALAVPPAVMMILATDTKKSDPRFRKLFAEMQNSLGTILSGK